MLFRRIDVDEAAGIGVRILKRPVAPVCPKRVSCAERTPYTRATPWVTIGTRGEGEFATQHGARKLLHVLLNRCIVHV